MLQFPSHSFHFTFFGDKRYQISSIALFFIFLSLALHAKNFCQKPQRVWVETLQHCVMHFLDTNIHFLHSAAAYES